MNKFLALIFCFCILAEQINTNVSQFFYFIQHLNLLMKISFFWFKDVFSNASIKNNINKENKGLINIQI